MYTSSRVFYSNALFGDAQICFFRLIETEDGRKMDVERKECLIRYAVRTPPTETKRSKTARARTHTHTHNKLSLIHI